MNMGEVFPCEFRWWKVDTSEEHRLVDVGRPWHLVDDAGNLLAKRNKTLR
jgi:hypothetical protein